MFRLSMNKCLVKTRFDVPKFWTQVHTQISVSISLTAIISTISFSNAQTHKQQQQPNNRIECWIMCKYSQLHTHTLCYSSPICVCGKTRSSHTIAPCGKHKHRCGIYLWAFDVWLMHMIVSVCFEHFNAFQREITRSVCFIFQLNTYLLQSLSNLNDFFVDARAFQVFQDKSIQNKTCCNLIHFHLLGIYK